MFAELLDRFLEQLPRWCEYAVEIRERALLTAAYRDVLARHGVAHVCSYWSAMPSPEEQARFMRVEGGPFTMVRLLLRAGTRYEERRQEMAPFNRIARADDRMRRQVVSLLRTAAADRKRPTCWSTTRPRIGTPDDRGDRAAPGRGNGRAAMMRRRVAVC